MSRVVLWSFYLLYALDVAGLGVVLVVFAPLLIDPANSFLPTQYTVGTRNVLLGILFAAYPLTQFFAAPFLGELSDRVGRKRPLLFSCIATAAAFCLSAFAIFIESYFLLVLSRLWAGFSSGNMTIAQAAVSDGIEKEKVSSAMAMFNMIAGIGWIIAPFGGSVLTDRNLVSWFSFPTPFIVLAIFFLLIGFLLAKYFHEHRTFEKKVFSFKAIAADYKEIFLDNKLRTYLLMSFLSIFTWILYQGFMSTYLDERYQFNENQIGRTFAYFSFFWFLGGLLASKWLFKKISPKKALSLPLWMVPLAIGSYLVFKTSAFMWISSAVANIAESIIIGCFFAIFALEAKENQHGKIFGFWNASLALSFFITPILAESMSIVHINLPFFIAAILGITLIFWFYRCHKLHYSSS